jgi:PAS domain S-box-containing protein
MAAIDRETDRVVRINNMFEQNMGKLYKISSMAFPMLATEGDLHRIKLEQAIESVKAGTTERAKARNIEMLTLAGEGIPIKKHFDWTVGRGPDGTVLLFGDPCTEQDVEQRAKDSELVDFFQNAPIALHWLSGDGIVLWANQRELDVLGYTAEEYIGQPIMKFCPDEEELVLEIFKQLGSGNTIKDVPVRFRAKDGHIVDLLIDSNVKYDCNGNFDHTRCFIRDDTKRKITEARAKLLLEETKRSLKMLDNFMSRSLHHMRTPLHVLQGTIDAVASSLMEIKAIPSLDRDTASMLQESLDMLHHASGHIDNAVVMIDDISDLARLDQGGAYKLKPGIIGLKDFGKRVLSVVSPSATNKVELALELTGGGPTFLNSDADVIEKVLRHLLENAVNVTEHGSITLRIGHEDDRCVFTVIDSGPGVATYEPAAGCTDTKLPPIFQRYHQEMLPDEILDFDQAMNLREKIEQGINSHRKVSIGLGLSLSYHLVLALGGDLRYSSQPGLTKFWFSVPQSHDELPSERIVLDTTVARHRRSHVVPIKQVDVEPYVPKSSIACNGLKAMDPPSVLVVEDVNSCAKILCNALRKVNCSTTWVENGQQAVDLLRTSPPGMYSLVLMDLRMPIMDGLTATKIIKDELKMKIPVIALTGDAGDETKTQCKEIGFDEYCNKPMKRAQLLDVIQKHTGYDPNGKDNKDVAQDRRVSQ